MQDQPNSNWLQKIPRIINAAGTLTKFGGSWVWPNVIAAMQEVSNRFVNFAEFHREAGKHIASMLQVEAAIVTTGAAGGLIQAAAACMTAMSEIERRRLPEVGPKSEIVIMRSHRNPYDQALRMSGATLVEVGNAIETQASELDASFSPKTAAVAFFLQSETLNGSLSLESTLEIAHSNNVPVIVDAAAELPPKKNLWELAHRGSDIVIFSGGKEIRGPQTSGLIVGKKEYIDAIYFNSAPNDGVGRPLKAGKEIVAGLGAAIESYLEEDEKVRYETWEHMCEEIISGLEGIPGIAIEKYQTTQPRIQPLCVPRLKISGDGHMFEIAELIEQFLTGDPAIALDSDHEGLIINVQMLRKTEISPLVMRAREIFERP